MAAERNVDDLLRVLEVTRRLAAPGDLAGTLSAVIDAARGVLRADRGSVFLHDADAGELYTFVGTGLDDVIRVPDDAGIVGETARTRRAIRIDDAYADERFNHGADRATGYTTRCLLSLPLVGLDDELVGVLQVLNRVDGSCFEEDDLALAELIAAQAAAALQRARLVEDRLRAAKLAADLEIARQVQQDVIPDDLPDVPGYAFAATARPAEETGGDIYDHLDVEQGVGLLLADATGHGIGAALSVTQARSMIRVGARAGVPWLDLLHAVNAQLTADLALTRFVTLFFGRLDPAAHRVEYVAAGQAPLLIVTADGELQWREATAMPLGIHDPLPGDDELTLTLELAPGDTLVLLTDGYYEAMSPADEELGQAAIGDVCRAHHAAGPEALLAALDAAVTAHAAGRPQDDDQTALILQRQP